MSEMRGKKVMQKMLVNNKCRFPNLMKITVINNAEASACMDFFVCFFFTSVQIMNVMLLICTNNNQTNVLCSSSQKVLTNTETLLLWSTFIFKRKTNTFSF